MCNRRDGRQSHSAIVLWARRINDDSANTLHFEKARNTRNVERSFDALSARHGDPHRCGAARTSA